MFAGRLSLLVVLSAALPAAEASATVAALPQCETIVPPSHLPTGQRALVPEDLVRLRDIGPVEPEGFAEPFFTISSDGHRAAFQLRQADPARNVYCLAMAIVDLSRKESPKIIDEGEDPILLTLDLRGITNSPTGIMRVISPRWSPEGRWIAFLKRTHGRTQVWRAFADGSGSEPLTHSNLDIVDFRFGFDGSTIVYATRPGLETSRREAEAEGRSGWHYDGRFVPFLSKRPMPAVPAERTAEVLDLATKQIRAATPEEAALVNTDHELIATAGAAPAIANNGLQISTTDLAGGARAGAFHARLPDNSLASCTAPACEGARIPWWMPGKGHVRFMRREGWANASTAIYDWNLRTADVRRIYVTDDVLSSCTPTDISLICLVDSSLEPRRLIRLDPASGERETLFDPNPEFAHLTLGKPVRLHWRNSFGIETVGDLVLPVSYRAEEKVPMVVVQYDTRGFLRGGTGDEYPIQAFANRGYAVLSFKRPSFTSERQGAKNFDIAGRLNLEHFADRKSVESSLEEGVRLAIASGIADPARIGITGLSDGTTTTAWALIHTSLFSAAAMSTCCFDTANAGLVGPASARHFIDEGYPGILGRNAPFWKDMSLSVNAHSLSTPILLQDSEDEMLTSLETYSGLREAGVPVDMFVYPDEHHVRWEPAHRLATYRRSLDWFDYWLRGIRTGAPDRQSELKNWDQLRIEGGHGKPL